MTYVVDIDGTICHKLCELKGQDYLEADPIPERIDKINKLYDEGHTIIYLTARGMGRSANNPTVAIQTFYKSTQDQLKSWGAKYHHLMLGKPAADFYIDDKGVNADDFFE